MKQKLFIILFFALGISFALITIYLSWQPKATTIILSDYTPVSQAYRTTNTIEKFDNADLGSIAIGIISASCFMVSGILISKDKT